MFSFIKILFVAIIFYIPLLAPAQVGRKGSINISTGADVLLASHSLASTHSVGYGFSLKSEYVFARHVSATAAGSFYQFPSGENGAISFIPLLAGLRYYIGNVYIGAEAGTGLGLQPTTENGFMYVFSVGDELFARNGGNSLDVSIRIQNWRQERPKQFYGLRIAYEFRVR